MPLRTLIPATLLITIATHAGAAFTDDSRWAYSGELMVPFWQSNVVHGETILFLRDSKTGQARGALLFPVKDIISVKNSAGDVTYQEGRDFHLSENRREIIVPRGSKVVTKTAADLRRPANSQKHRLTHRDGKGEILFGAKLEYHQMQTCITYTKASKEWPVELAAFDASALPKTITKLQRRQPTSIVLLGDSISSGCNASGWAGGAPFQPAYQDLLSQHLEAHYGAEVALTNLSVSGMSTPWGLAQIGEVVKSAPDLVILAFGMNDAASRSPEEFGRITAEMIKKTRESRPDTEFILLATMLGNRDWTVLKHDVFPKYRDVLDKLSRQDGVALADLTSVWTAMLQRKRDSDLTGNGVNHPNDFGHRVYAQVLSSLLLDAQTAE